MVFKSQSGNECMAGHYVECSKGHNSKGKQVRVVDLVFSTMSHDSLHLYIVS